MFESVSFNWYNKKQLNKYMNKKNIILIVILVVVILLAGFLIFNKEGVDSNDATNILFYGDGCPHCIIVDKYITDNNVEQKFTFTREEVFNNQENAKILVAKAKICNIPTDNGVGVPFLWVADSKTCILGDQPIIDFFTKAINLPVGTGGNK